MSWLASFGVALLTAAVGTVVSGYVANLAVVWYRVPGFEGGAGYFVLAYALLGLVVGAIVGLVAARVVAATAAPGFVRALGASLGLMLLLVAVVGGTARALADVPPTIDGERLVLAVELRWPSGAAPTAPGAPTDTGDEPHVRLGSLTRAHVLRVAERGALWIEDARQVDGRWVAPGAVHIFTSRGTRALEFHLDDATHPGFIVPLPARPGRAQEAWSAWLPRARPGDPPRPNDEFSYRFRVQRAGDVVRTERVGAFEVATHAHSFYEDHDAGRLRIAAVATFTLRHAGQPFVIEARPTPAAAPSRFATADGIATVGGHAGAPLGLLVHVASPESDGYCFLLTGDATTAHVEPLGDCLQPFDVDALTNDVGRFRASQTLRVPHGRIDRLSFAEPGLYLMGHRLVDTRTLTVRAFTTEDGLPDMPSVPPLALSPDERSFVWFRFAGHEEQEPQLLVTDVVTGRTTVLPIDRARMRFPTPLALDPAWVAHHFVWERRDGMDRLVERPGFVPLP